MSEGNTVVTDLSFVESRIKDALQGLVSFNPKLPGMDTEE